jgi:hypothetical protein
MCEHGISPWWNCDDCRGTSAFAVDAFEPRYDEHLSTDGLTYTSAREKQRFMDANAVVEKKNPHASRIARGATGASLFFDMGRK